MSTRLWRLCETLTVIKEPHTKVLSGLIPAPTSGTFSIPKKSSITPGPSPAKTQMGRRTTALRRLVYQESKSALPSTTFRLCLITTECMAVMAELATPKLIPTSDRGVPSRKTPTKKPRVTMEHETRMRSDGRDCRIKKEVQTVKGRTSPRAT